MSDSNIPVQDPGTISSRLDAESLTVGIVTVKRERLQIAGVADIEIARVKAVQPANADQGLVVRPINAPLEATYLTSTGRTTTQTQGDQDNPGYKGIAVVLDMTAVGTGSVTLEIDGKDPLSGKYVPLLTGVAVTTNSTNVYTIYPGGPVTANVSAGFSLWRTWRIKVTANNANSATYTVGYILLP